MATYPTDFIQDGTVTTYGAGGEIVNVQKLNPQQLATDETADKLLKWLTINIPEGCEWTLEDIYLGMNGPNYKYSCPCWQAVAANGQKFSAGVTYFNLFNYPNPTTATVDELHSLASAPAPEQ